MHPSPALPLALMRPDDGDAFRLALRTAQTHADLPVVFGGPVRDEILSLTQLIGVRTTGLRGLSVCAAAGLGGQVLVRRRPVGVADYKSADTITHDYDKPVLGEGIRSIVGVPVVVAGAVRGVLYGASRGSVPLGDRATDVVVTAARRLSQELATRDEVDRRVRLQRAAETEAACPASRAEAEEIRELNAELRVIAQAMEDASLRARLLDASRRLAALGAVPAPREVSPLAPREIDVLSQVALGCTNAEAGARLSLSPETVKAYMRSAMRKLDARTRFEAVVTARRQGLLP